MSPVKLLGHRHSRAVHQLIIAARAGLTEETRHWLKPRSQGEISAHFASCNPVFGIMNGKGELVACALLKPLADAEDPANHLNYPAEALKDGHWAVQSLAVHPDYQGRGLMTRLLTHVTDYARTHPSIHSLIAKVNSRHTGSQQGFLNTGFTIAAQGQDHASGDPVVYLGHFTGSGLARTGGRPLQLGHDDPAPASPLG